MRDQLQWHCPPAHCCGAEFMVSIVYYVVCAAGLMFFVVFFVGCSSRRRTRRKATAVHKLPQLEAVDSVCERRFLARLEEQMAEFISAHHGTTAPLLLATILLSISDAAHG